MRFDFEEVFGDEIFDLFVATHHQPQHRCLDTTDGEYALITRVAPENGVGTGHVDPVQPVRTGTRQRGDTQGNKFAVGAQA
ncbi:Uncharacterised protein [Enterobacter cloacae]|nr:Uncharacterised protein [Enterobacter cloacae]